MARPGGGQPCLSRCYDLAFGVQSVAAGADLAAASVLAAVASGFLVAASFFPAVCAADHDLNDI